MNILHFNTYDLKGGAARGTYWLHRALQRDGITSQLVVMDRRSDDPSVIGPRTSLQRYRNEIHQIIEALPMRWQYPEQRYRFSPAWLPNNILPMLHQVQPDIVHLHWVCDGFMTPEILPKIPQPVIWTLRDMWVFTGGCHYSEGCQRYETVCGACPILGSQQTQDWSHRVWQRKHKAWKHKAFTVVAISHWLADCARRSPLLQDHRIEVIHNALDETVFKPIPQRVAREILNLPPDQQIILFGAVNGIQNPTKGFQYLQHALRQLSQGEFGDAAFAQQTGLLIFGCTEPPSPPETGLPTRYLGRLQDDVTLALVYAAADVMVVPSIQEAFGKVAMEAIACGIPVVSFDTTGLKDIVEHQRNGYRASCFDAADLARGIAWVLADRDRWQHLSHRAREKVEQEFTLARQVQTYKSLYADVLRQSIP
jgi:glycosyltransferase involved in cell wall biosynthesis